MWRARWRDRTRQEALADWAGASLRGRWVGWRVSGGRAPSGREWRARNRARARSNWASQGQRCGRCSVRWPERVIRPAREKNRRRRVLVVTTCSPRPMRAVQRARLWAHHLYRQPGGVEAARGEMVQPHTVLEVSDGILDLGVAAMVGLQFEHLPVPVGDEAVLAVGGEEGHEPGVGFTRRTMSRTGAASGSLWKGVQVVSATSAAPCREWDPGILWASMRLRRLLCWRMVMEKRTSILRRRIPRHECRTLSARSVSRPLAPA